MKKSIFTLLLPFFIVVYFVGIMMTIVSCADEASDTTTNNDTTFSVTSTAFIHNGKIPVKYTFKAGINNSDAALNTSLPLAWSNAPSGTQSFIVYMYDFQSKESPHWLITDIPSTTTSLTEGAYTVTGQPTNITSTTNNYYGPFPPFKHFYDIMVFALDSAIGSIPILTNGIPDTNYQAFAKLLQDFTINPTGNSTGTLTYSGTTVNVLDVAIISGTYDPANP